MCYNKYSTPTRKHPPAKLPMSQVPPPSQRLTAEDVFAGPDPRGKVAKGARQSPDGAFITWLGQDPDFPWASALWLMSAAGGPARVVLSNRETARVSEELSDAAMKALERRHRPNSPPMEYQWNAGSSRLLVSLGSQLLLVDAKDGSTMPVDVSDADKLDPQLAPGDAWVSYVRNNQLFIHEVASGHTIPVGDDASDAVSYGTAEFVAQEEMQRFTGHWWSPCGERIAYTRVDETAVRTTPRIRIGSTSTLITNDRFPFAGTANAGVSLFVRSVPGGQAVQVDLGSDPDFYLWDATWSKDGQTLYVQRQSRDQRRLDLLAVDPADGTSRLLLSELSDTWVALERTFRPLEDGCFLWGSARSGWQHLYLYDRDGGLVRTVTHGDWRIAWTGPTAPPNYSPIIGVDEAAGDLYFIASIESPLEQHLYRMAYRLDDEPHRITAGHGWWIPTMAENSPSGFIGEYSDPDTPPQVSWNALNGERLAWLSENRLDATHPAHRGLDHRPTFEYGSITAENGTDLHWVLVRPADFDASRRYPAIVKVYGGPGVQMVRREWRATSEQLLTQGGYVVFQLDNRGTPNRDIAFEHAHHGGLGGASVRDQLAGIRFLQSLPFIDPDRIAMAGWSFGAYVTLRALTTQASGLRAGVAGAAPSDFLLYDTHYMERFLGRPEANPQGYESDGLLPRMKDLHGELLLIHGLSDDNVILQNFTALVAELQNQGKLFDVAVYPGQGHAVRGEKPLVHLWKTFMRFYDRALAPRSEIRAQ